MYVVAEEDVEANGIVIVSSKWLTPRKEECFWPNAKVATHYNKILQKHESPGENWSLIRLKRRFFETDSYQLARQKAKEAEYNSDLTDADGEEIIKRKRKLPIRVHSSSDEEDVFQHHKSQTKKHDIFQNSELDSSVACSLITPKVRKLLLETSTSNLRAPPNKTPSPAKTPQPAETPSPLMQSLLTDNSFQNLYTPQPPCKYASGFEYNSMKIQDTICEQNKQILNWIRIQNEAEILKTKRNPIDLPVTFPLKTETELLQLESEYAENDKNFADLCEYFTAFTVHTVTGTVNQILKHTLTNNLAMTFSYRGKKGKKAFDELNLKTAIIRGTKKIFKIQQEKSIEDDIKVWLKHAPQQRILEERKILSRLNSRNNEAGTN